VLAALAFVLVEKKQKKKRKKRKRKMLVVVMTVFPLITHSTQPCHHDFGLPKQQTFDTHGEVLSESLQQESVC
jgi:hypothetical protein